MPRKLTAILSADVAGYSRLMACDEAATVRNLTAHRQIITTVVNEHHGRVVDSPGDNLLAEFPSAVDAVAGAVAVQRRLKAQNQALPQQRRMRWRMGVNLGDVISEEGRLYGDGVNVAARIEGLAAPGGVSISASIHEQVKNKLELGFEDQGRHKVKNIAEPVWVYRVLPSKTAVSHQSYWALLPVLALALVVAGAWGLWRYHLAPSTLVQAPREQAASPAKRAHPLPGKPSIAVLPFDNLSGDAGQQYLCDGITENIIAALSKMPRLFVIARNSVFTYQGKAVKVQQVAEELGVHYVLEGSVLKAGDKLRVTAQLVDATSGHHLWAETYDQPMGDLFKVMDGITKKIAVSLEVKLSSGEQARLWHRTASLKAWGEMVRGFGAFITYDKEGNAKARRLFRRAVELDPDYAFAWTMLAWTYFIDARFGYTGDPGKAIAQAQALGHRAEALDLDQPQVHALLGYIALMQGNYQQALAQGEKSVTLGPNEITALVLFAQTLTYTGQPQRAVTLCRRALRMHPHAPAYIYLVLGNALRDADRLEQARDAFLQGLKRAPGGLLNIAARLGLVAVYMQTGQKAEARAMAQAVLEEDPHFDLRRFRASRFYQDPALQQKWESLLLKAGLPPGPAVKSR